MTEACRPRLRAALLAAALVAASLLRATPVHAHALDPVLFELQERPDGKVDVTWKAPNAKVPGVDLRPLLPAECRQEGEKTTSSLEEAVVSKWVVDCGGTLVGRTVGVLGLESTDALLRVALASGSVDRRVLGADHASVTIEGQPGRLEVVHDYARLGVEHIAGGIDHLLFVFGLLLLTGGTRLLLATVTAFTLGHSVTLAAAALQFISVPQAPVEVIIAVTIYVLAVELARDAPPGSTLLNRRPWAMAFVFGLLHGLGFAGALREAGLPANDIPLALVSFNVGIEAGQLMFVGAVLAASAAMRPLLGALPAAARRIPVYAMGIASAYWIFARAAIAF